MKTINLFKSILAIVAIALTSIIIGCSPEKPENEKEHKLHEDPVRAVFTLQEGTLDNVTTFDKQPKKADFKASSAPAQVIEWQTTAGEGWHRTSQTEAFNVKNCIDNPNVVYLLTMQY